MPSFLARRYAREQVPALERSIAALVLLLTVGIVATLTGVALRPAPPLFQTQPGSERSGANRELFVARSMMPPLGTAGWSDATDVRTVTPGEGNVSLAYEGRYRSVADPNQTVPVLIRDTGEPRNARQLFESDRPATAVALNVGCKGWQTASAGGFWAGRYYTHFDRSTVQTPDPTIQVIADALAGVQIRYEEATPASAGTANAAPPKATTESPLPKVELAGWEPPGDIREFTPENLWEKIDGRAEAYLSFHMVRMTFGTYRSLRDPDAFIDVYWYDMMAPDNAFGIYRAERGLQATDVNIGRGGYTSPGGVFFWKGRHYVRVEAPDAGEKLAEAATAIARTLEGRIPDEGEPMWADALLPAADRLPGSLDYHAKDAFSLDFLSDTFSADYNAGGKTFKTFIHRAADAADAERIFGAYAKFFETSGSLLKRESGDGLQRLVGESGGVVDAVFQTGRYVGGVTGGNDAALAEERAAAFAQSLKEKGGK